MIRAGHNFALQRTARSLRFAKERFHTRLLSVVSVRAAAERGC